MWTDEHRALHGQTGTIFPSNLTDQEWARLEPLIPAATPGGRPRKTDMRAAINAILYLLWTGCPWRYLPRDGFPPRSTVYTSSASSSATMCGSRSGPSFIWRRASGSGARPARPPPSSTARPSSRPKRGSQDHQMGYDAGKRLKGRKIHALVHTEGLPMKVVVHSAGMQDRDGAALVLARIRNHLPWLELIWADAGYDAHHVKTTVAAILVVRIEIVRRTDDLSGFRVQPRRWVVERTFSWFGRNRRLAKDYENLADILAAFLALAAIRIALKRLARPA